MGYYRDDLKRINRGLKDVNTIISLFWDSLVPEQVQVNGSFDSWKKLRANFNSLSLILPTEAIKPGSKIAQDTSNLENKSIQNSLIDKDPQSPGKVISWIGSGCSRLNKMFKQPVLGRINLVSMFLYRLCRLLVLDLNMITDRLHQTISSSTNVAGSDNPGSSGFDEADVLELYSSLMDLQKKHDQCNSELVGLLTRLKPSLTRKNTSNLTQQIGSEEPQPSNQTTDPESIDHQSEFTAVSILSSQQMTVVNLQSDLQNSSSSSLPVSLRLPLSPTTRSRLTPKSKSTNTTKPAAIRPHTPDLTNSRPKSPSQINLGNLVENWGGGGPSELSYRLPDPPSPISAFEINLSTQSNDSQSSLNHSLNQDQRCPMYHQPKVQVRSGLGHQVLGQTVDPKPLPNHDLPQRTLIIQALPPSEYPESNRSNTPGQSWPENLPNHQLSSKLEIEHKDEDSEEEDTDDDFLGNE
ncbi:hypothetical protein PPACK8108_LOCUS22143 [Phakopsora pachyrhizi]|uniref:Uncharacterized protein n=1 Tax=Phakopsora pachyrhizi TaxID=170000 RepID=A0AAV0BLN8_PHAPC|nr:hypothetical protein PPACK8108_LOCUS22143 [Phakopsora pachyrhizi]